MDIIISNAVKKPIYEQIASQIKNMIMTGVLKEGEVLSSMCLLAKELRISVITTKRVYEDLERDGFIEVVPGKGSFVANKNMEFIREEHLRMIKEFSKEMKMKLSIATTLSHNPKLLILDEATSGLDPIVRNEILDLLFLLKVSSLIIMLSLFTSYLISCRIYAKQEI